MGVHAGKTKKTVALDNLYTARSVSFDTRGEHGKRSPTESVHQYVCAVLRRRFADGGLYLQLYRPAVAVHSARVDKGGSVVVRPTIRSVNRYCLRHVLCHSGYTHRAMGGPRQSSQHCGVGYWRVELYDGDQRAGAELRATTAGPHGRRRGRSRWQSTSALHYFRHLPARTPGQRLGVLFYGRKYRHPVWLLSRWLAERDIRLAHCVFRGRSPWPHHCADRSLHPARAY